ncbi:formin-like protein 14 [Sorghum bicolor]|uniref:formin-like protein 14 n=1 Tax=Sorghum bicolor TaxID=4558 RepID=UPI000B42442C|nr:formin-like protein 14 [Sorghum bicolor]|eukprot:XP_021319335.1 formin-like protein 14 [Sorghum bicolor]
MAICWFCSSYTYMRQVGSVSTLLAAYRANYIDDRSAVTRGPARANLFTVSNSAPTITTETCTPARPNSKRTGRVSIQSHHAVPWRESEINQNFAPASPHGRSACDVTETESDRESPPHPPGQQRPCEPERHHHLHLRPAPANANQPEPSQILPPAPRARTCFPVPTQNSPSATATAPIASSPSTPNPPPPPRP